MMEARELVNLGGRDPPHLPISEQDRPLFEKVMVLGERTRTRESVLAVDKGAVEGPVQRDPIARFDLTANTTVSMTIPRSATA